MTNKLTLRLNEGGAGSVTLNGLDIGGCVTRLEYKAAGGELAEIKITILAELDADLEAAIDATTVVKSAPVEAPSERRWREGYGPVVLFFGALAVLTIAFVWFFGFYMERRGYCLSANLCTATVDGKPRPGYSPPSR